MGLKGKVLLLSPSYELLDVIEMERAVQMLFRDDNKGHIVEDTGETLHSAGGVVIPKPSVIRLSEYKNIREKIRISRTKRLKVFTRDKFQCQYCGIKPGLSKLTLDHVFPESRGGKTEPDNLVASCKPCNNKKANRTPEEAGMKLLKPLRKFEVGIGTLLRHYWAERFPDWAKYLYMDSGGDPKLQNVEEK